MTGELERRAAPVDRPTLRGSEQELVALTEWLHTLDVLRARLHDEDGSDVGSEQIRLLVRRLTHAENRLRAFVGLPPLL